MSDGFPEQELALPTLERLAPREREYLLLFLQGHPQKEIAYRMSVSESAVSQARSRVIDKLGARTDLDLVMFGYRSGLIDQDGRFCQDLN